ncbi:MAG TPA: lipoprotein [Steroidobacteraceae bacterium]|nr:lipoprotein [Steroidobacteraceae bacterium]
MRYAVCILLALCAGCGQKGPLTLPDKHPGTVVTRPVQAPATPTDETGKKKDETEKKP